MKNLLFYLKAVKTGTVPTKLKSEPERKLLKVRAGAGAGKNSFGSATLAKYYGENGFPLTRLFFFFIDL